MRIYNIRHFSIFAFQFLFCIYTPFKFSVYNNYTKDNFSGWDISSHTIVMTPILTEDGWIAQEKFSYSELIKKLKKIRPDLSFQNPESLHSLVSKKIFPDEKIESVYKNLFNGAILFLQNYDTLWNNINYDYLLVLKIKSGSYIKTFDNLSKKKIKLELELWDTKEKECSWRVEISGECWSKKVKEQDFIGEAIIKALSLLPFSLPGYDRWEW